MKIIVTGAEGFIGKALVAELSRENSVVGTTRKELDLLELGSLQRFEYPHVTYLCAAKTRFIDCERDQDAYRVNVDAQVEMAKFWNGAKVIYLSSEAVESTLHTAYGMHKALCEMGLRAVCNPIIARLGKVTPENLGTAVRWLASLKNRNPGVYRWIT